MKLVSCYISSFGRIKDFEYDFSDGLNTILQENGWGKSTFSEFIKAMFFGMDYAPTKKILIDRKHYLPWDGTKCGGVLVFEADGKRYRINRSFGKTDKDDTFELYDEATGLPSEDFSEDIGQELFKVDKDSFEKTVYMPQNALSTGMTDSINAKMGGLSEAKNDISNFDSALKLMKEAKAGYTRNSKVNPGKQLALKQEISRIKEELERLPAVNARLENQTEVLRKHKAQADECASKKSKLVAAIEAQSKREQEIGAYRLQKESLEQEKKAFEVANTALAKADKGGFDRMDFSEETFARMNRSAKDLAELRAKAASVQIHEQDEKRLQELEFFFTKKLPSFDELEDLEKKANEIPGLQAKEEHAREELSELKAKKVAAETKESAKPTTMIIGVLLLFSFAAVLFTQASDGIKSLSGIMIAAGFVLMVVGLFSSLKKNRERDAEIEKAAREFEEAAQDYEALCGKLTGLNKSCNVFLSDFLLSRSDTVLDNLYEIRRKLDEYNRLQDTKKELEQRAGGVTEALAEKQQEFTSFMAPYLMAYGITTQEPGTEFDFILQLKKDADIYKNAVLKANAAKERLDKVAASVKAFEAVNDISEETESVAELQEKQKSLDDEIRELTRLLQQDERDLRRSEEELEELTELAESLDSLEERGDYLKSRVSLIEETTNMLQKSKESFLSKYIKPLKSSLQHYLGMIDEGSDSGYEIEAYDIDLDLNVRLDLQGSFMGLEYFSEGYKDLIGLCSRMAMIDVMYEEETPVIIMDDPFVNLDEEKLTCAMKLLAQISREKQIIYFTCHQARA